MKKGQPNHIICFIITFLLIFTNIQVFASTVLHVSKVKINKTTDTLRVGQTDIIRAIFTPVKATNRCVKWTSSNTTIAKVDVWGKITSLRAGTTTITGRTVDKGLKVYCKITIKPAIRVSKVKINKTADSLTVGQTDIIRATFTPTNATNRGVKWTSSNTTIAKVDIYGKVTSLNVGTATITGKTVDKGLKVYCKITVKIPAIATTKNISKLIKYGFTYKSLYGKGTSPDYVFYNYIYSGRPSWHQVNDLTVGLDGNSVCIAIQYWQFSNSKVPSLTQKALNVFLSNGGNQIYSRINQLYNRSDFSEINNETHQISGHKVTISTGAGGNIFVTIYN